MLFHIGVGWGGERVQLLLGVHNTDSKCSISVLIRLIVFRPELIDAEFICWQKSGL